ncbi:MAG TPA: hypothetical protein VN253_30265 [Kofleriaceae bacterium]|nr:hypothetical protein [Kofleriaceae bacterium]
MTINTSVPTNLRTPGGYHEFKFDAAGQQLVPFDRRVVILAEKSSAGTATADTPVQIFDETDGDAKFGKSSLGALMVRQALAQAKLSAVGSPEIWGCPVAENGAGTAAVYTITITGPATASSDLVLSIAGRVISVGVTIDDAQNTIAAALEKELDRLAAILPVTASVAANVVTLTFPTKGVNGNDVDRTTIRTPAGVTIAHAATVAGVGATAITNALAALYDRDYHGIAMANHATGDAAVILADAAFTWGFGQKNFKFYAMGERGSLGTAQTLEASYNDYRVLITSCEAVGSLPGELAVAQMVAWFAREAPNANLDNERLAIYPPPPASAYTAAEVESALASGLIPLVPDGPFVKIVRLVTSQITVSSVPFEPLRDAAYPRTAAYMAKQIDAGFLTGFKQEVLSDSPEDDVLQRVRDMVIEKHRAAQTARYIRDVDAFLDQIQVEIAAAPAGRLVVSDPFRVAGPLHQGVFVHTMYQ